MWMVRPQTWSQNILSARSVSETDLQLGEVKFSYGYGGTAKVDSEELSGEKGVLTDVHTSRFQRITSSATMGSGLVREMLLAAILTSTLTR